MRTEARRAVRRGTGRTWARRLACALAAVAALAATAARADDARAARFLEECARIEAQGALQVGVHARDLDSGEAVSCRSTETWYLASTVKVPVAIAVLRGVEAGRWSLDTVLTLRAADVVDGGPLAAARPVGSAMTVRALLEQMIVHSDNTASDMLIGLVGIAAVNALVGELVPIGFGRITSLGDVRRRLYAQLVPEAEGLDGERLLALHRARSDEARLQVLAQLTGTPVARFRLPGLEAAYDAYYATRLNSGRLDAYVDLLEALAGGRALGPEASATLLDTMERVATGPRRIRAGLPADARFAHKTGTQRGRFCDAGLIVVPRAAGERRVAVAACTRGQRSPERAERALRQVGLALCRSGLLDRGAPDAAPCPEEPDVPMPVDPAPRR